METHGSSQLKSGQMLEENFCDQCDWTGKCSECNGTGTNTHLNSSDRKCPHCSGTGICSGSDPYYRANFRVRDDRPVGEQILSGVRLTGCGLLFIALLFLLLASTGSLAGQGDYTQPIHRILAGWVLLAISILLFITARIWARFLAGLLLFVSGKGALAVLFGFSASVPSIRRPRLVFLEYLVVSVFAAILCSRYLKHTPNTAEAVGLVGVVIGICFSMAWDSNLPVLAGATVLGLIQLAHGIRQRHVKLN
jgi:hypothetical protein